MTASARRVWSALDAVAVALGAVVAAVELAFGHWATGCVVGLLVGLQVLNIARRSVP